MVLAFKKNVRLGGGDNTSSLFYGKSILTSNFASCSSGQFFLSSSLQLIVYSLVSVVMFVSKPTFMQQKFAYDVGLVSTYSVHKYSTFFSIFAGIEFKVSLLISLLYMSNKVLPSFCRNLHLTLIHCDTPL